MTRERLSWWRVAIPLAAALGFRLFFAWRFPFEAGDTRLYEELARNWLHHGVYGLVIEGKLTPVDIRAPGYPAFLALIYWLVGYSRTAVFFAQAALDTVTCFFTSRLAARLVREEKRARVQTAALWLAALCPFTANYVATPLTETLATFLTVAALLQFACALQEARPSCWFGGALAAGLGTLVRPETPLLLLATGLVVAWLFRKPAQWPALARAGLLMGAGLFLALLPWGARNWLTLHRVQFLAPRYAELPGEAVPHGFNAWTKTWLVRFRDVYLTLWKVDGEPISIEDIPPQAFDSPEERERVASLLARYNETLTIEPDWDDAFAQLARERTARRPLRTLAWVPLQRVATLWFTPRTELLEISGKLWPPAQKLEEDPVDFSTTLALGVVNVFYCALALWGVIRVVRGNSPLARQVAGVLLAFVLLRTAFFTTVETPEPRYVLVCYPAMIAFAACAMGRRGRDSPIPA